MAVENVVCPRCGQPTYVTVPIGQCLVKVTIYGEGSYFGSDNLQHCRCHNCNRDYYAITKEIDANDPSSPFNPRNNNPFGGNPFDWNPFGGKF